MITWKIDWLKKSSQEVNGLPEVVVSAGWRASISDDVNVFGEIQFPEPTDKDFTPFEKLTEEEVLSWVWASVDKQAIEDSLEESVTAPLPWETTL